MMRVSSWSGPSAAVCNLDCLPIEGGVGDGCAECYGQARVVVFRVVHPCAEMPARRSWLGSWGMRRLWLCCHRVDAVLLG